MPQTLNQDYQDLIVKAQQLFWIKGYKGVKADELAKHLDVSTSTIYNKYPKEMLFIDSLKYYNDTCSDPFLKHLRETANGLDSLRQFFYTLIDTLLEKTFPRSCLMVNTVVELRDENSTVNEMYKGYFDNLITSYMVVLDKAIEEKEIKHPEKKEEYARFLLGEIFAVSVLYRIKSREELRQYIDEQLRFIV